MNDIQARIERLSPEQREKFEAMLKQEREKASATVEGIKIPQITPNPKDRFEPFPLTDIQQAQWFGRSGLFNITVAGHGYVEFDCAGMSLERLELALRKLISTHDQLRMVVLPNLRQQVLEHVPDYQIKRYDMRNQPTEAVEQTLADVRDRMSHDILPADKWPVFEVCATLWDTDQLRIHFSFDLLVGDAWCFRMLIDEWDRLYENLDGGRKTPAELTYRDYVLGLEELEKSELFDQDLAYWCEQLEDLPPPPSLPMINTQESLKEIRAEHYSVYLSVDEWNALKDIIKKRKLTPSGFFAMALSEVISLWNEGPAHTLNMTIFNRLPLHPDVNDILVGEFNSFQLLACDNSTQQSFESRAAKLQALMWQHLDHRYISGVRLMRELAKIRNAAAGEALMPVVFTSTLAHHEGESDMPTRAPGKWVYEISQTPQVWMEHHLWEEDNQLALHIDVVKGLFPDNLIRDFVDVYEQLIRNLINDPSAWQKKNASYLLPKYQREIWQVYNNSRTMVPQGLLHDGFTQSARKYPAKLAIISARGQRTYAEVDTHSNQIGNWLQDELVQSGELVAVMAPKGWEQVVSVLGVLKSGAAYLPIDQDQPTERLHDILASGRVKYVLTTDDLINQVEWPDNIIPLDISSSAITTTRADVPQTRQNARDVAYVIFTSGSTGKPKGVAIDHRGALNTLADINQRFRVSSDDVIFAISSLSFDLSVYDIFGGLAAGATLVMPDSQKPDPKQWLELFNQYEFTVWNSVPALMELMVDYAEQRAETIPESLRLCMLSGDWVPLSLPARLQLINPDMQVISLGGATEASVWSIYYPVTHVRSSWASVPYGMPLANQTIHVLNAALEPCPLWVQGDLYIGGVGVAMCYWGDDEKTAASFIQHPVTGERLYRTGDLGRLLPEGYIEFLGRADTQVKVRGYRIELGDVESALNHLEMVKRSVVIASGDNNRDRHLVAYIVGEPEATELQQPDQSDFIAAIKKALAQKLPDYMIPETYVVLESLPLTANGKIDRKKLPSANAQEATVAAYAPPRTETEAKIAEIWKHLLNVEKVGIYDDFFQLGGNSLIASNLLYRINDTFEVELPLSELFDATTVEAIAQLVEQLILEQIAELSDDEAQLLAEV